jgi:pyruvate formate lyase activating enzyme
VDCFLCNRRCRIAAGESGACRVRENRQGVLYSLVYGRIIARHLDPIEKKPLYHFLPGTFSYSIATPGCNLRCSFCQNWQISQLDVTRGLGGLGYTAAEDVVEAAVAQKARSISYTYTEPTVFMEYALDCAALAHERGLRNVFVTNGYQTGEAIDAMVGLIDASNVDLKAFDDAFYRRHCGGRLDPVLDTIRRMHGAGMHVEVTTLVIPGRNDSEGELRAVAGFLAGISPELPWHISRFHPDYRDTDLRPTPIRTMQRAAHLGREAGLRYVYLGNVLTPEGQSTYCATCGHVLVRRSGYGPPEIQVEAGRCPSCRQPVPLVTE